MADIVIRDMETPKDHPVRVYIWPDGRVFPAGLYKASEWDGVKAVPLPEGCGWISVKDRLPELYQNVLVHYYNPHCVEPNNFAVAYRQDGFDEIIPGMNIWHVDSSPLELDGSDVTHWMPLPEPPKEGGGKDVQRKDC